MNVCQNRNRQVSVFNGQIIYISGMWNGCGSFGWVQCRISMLMQIVVKVSSVFIDISLLSMFSGIMLVSVVVIIFMIMVFQQGVWKWVWILLKIFGNRLLWEMVQVIWVWFIIIISIIEDRLVMVLILIVVFSQDSVGQGLRVVVIGLLVFSR